MIPNTLANTRFGSVEYEPSDVLTFPQGLVGFADVTQFIVLNHGEGSPFRWLQSVQEPALAFLVTDPVHFIPDYAPQVPIEQLSGLQLSDVTPRLLFVTVAIPHGKPEELSLNLAGPIVVNVENCLGMQFVLEDEAYNVRYRVFASESPGKAAVAA